MKKTSLLISATIINALLFTGCKNKNVIHKDDLIGVYKIDDGVTIDSTAATMERIKGYKEWTLTLEEHDNFEFKGHGDTIVGYWAFTGEEREPKNSILFQSGYMREDIIYAQFDKTKLLFKGPLSMFDSCCHEVLLKRVEE